LERKSIEACQFFVLFVDVFGFFIHYGAHKYARKSVSPIESSWNKWAARFISMDNIPFGHFTNLNQYLTRIF
jgi:hypothetical protein